MGCSGSRISLIKSKISRASNSSLFIGYWMVMWHDSCQPHGVAKWPLDGAFPYIFIPIVGTLCSFTLLIKKRRRCVLKNCVYTCENHTTESELRHYYYVIKWHPSQQDIKNDFINHEWWNEHVGAFSYLFEVRPTLDVISLEIKVLIRQIDSFFMNWRVRLSLVEFWPGHSGRLKPEMWTVVQIPLDRKSSRSKSGLNQFLARFWLIIKPIIIYMIILTNQNLSQSDH